MASIEMMYRADVVAFYEKHNLFPGCGMVVSYKTYLLVLFDALSQDESLYHFCVEGFTETVYGKYQLTFDSWSELISCYTSFMIGYTKNTRQLMM